MRQFGFSTGALARSDLHKALDVAGKHRTQAVEYSALRMRELVAVVSYLTEHGAGEFEYVAFHAPSRIAEDEEGEVVRLLRTLISKCQMQIVVHPDAIHNFDLWRSFGAMLCVENMDDRKLIGRTADELEVVFAKLPEARLCFDIGHAHEIDRSMSLGYEILRRFRNRIAHVHASEVSDDYEHRAFSTSSHAAFAKLADLIPAMSPIILETEVPENRVEGQLEEAKEIFEQGSFAMKTSIHFR